MMSVDTYSVTQAMLVYAYSFLFRARQSSQGQLVATTDSTRLRHVSEMLRCASCSVNIHEAPRI
jgi:cytochrome c-type biogenesis protein CcmH/NrfF